MTKKHYDMLGDFIIFIVTILLMVGIIAGAAVISYVAYRLIQL